jgi:hypothetical protein
LLDARRAISVTERQRYILRMRALAGGVARAYYESRQALGFPLLTRDGSPQAAAGATSADAGIPPQADARAASAGASPGSQGAGGGPAAKDERPTAAGGPGSLPPRAARGTVR